MTLLPEKQHDDTEKERTRRATVLRAVCRSIALPTGEGKIDHRGTSRPDGDSPINALQLGARTKSALFRLSTNPCGNARNQGSDTFARSLKKDIFANSQKIRTPLLTFLLFKNTIYPVIKITGKFSESEPASRPVVFITQNQRGVGFFTSTP